MHLPKRHWSYPLIALLAAIVMLARAAAPAFVYNNTIDEPYHIGSAVVLWEAKQPVVGVQHPPLARWVIGLPLRLQGVQFPEARQEFVVVEFPAFGVGYDLLFSGKLPYWHMLISARLALLVFPAIALFYLYRLGRYLAGSLVAMLATVFFSTDPTLMAHSALVGTDGAACAGFLFGLYHGVRWIARPNIQRAAIGGMALAIALCCKFSCVLLIPSLGLIVLARVAVARNKPRMLRRLIRPRAIVLAAGIFFLVIWAIYGFSVNPMRLQALLVREPVWMSIPRVIREQPIPMPAFWLGQIFLASRAAVSGQATYLNGEVSLEGWPIYFPEALALKEPLAFLFALVSAIGILLFASRSRRRLLRSLVLLLPFVFVFAFAMHSRYQLGIRHLLPILPLMYLFAVMQFARIGKHVVVIALIAITLLETATVHPDYLAFFNIACGGPRKGDRYLIDSNLDWGQDVYRLAQWLKSDKARGRPYTVRAAYGVDPLLKTLGLQPASPTTRPTGGLLAVSKNIQHRLLAVDRDLSPGGKVQLGEDYSWLSEYPVIKRIGYSIDVYDLDAKNPRSD